MFSFLLSQRPLLLSCTLCCFPIIAQATTTFQLILKENITRLVPSSIPFNLMRRALLQRVWRE